METTRKKLTGIDREITKKVGQILAQARQNKKITQVELAKRLNIEQSMISSYEKGTRRIPINQFIKIAEVMGISPEKLLGGTIEVKKNGRISRRFSKRIKEIEKLPEPEKKAIVKTIDALLLQYKIKEKDRIEKNVGQTE